MSALQPAVVSSAEWHAAHERLLAKEKDQMRARDALAAERRRQPMLAVEREYAFEGPDGPATLPDLFDGRSQLIVYHFMLAPDQEQCVGCSMFVDNLVDLRHLNARDTTLVLVATSPVERIEAVKRRMGWDVPWYSTGSDFNADMGVRRGFGLNVFLRDRERILRTYFTNSRGVEAIGSVWSLLDVTPLGRQETWQDAPDGTPQTPPYGWWRLHDEYDAS